MAFNFYTCQKVAEMCMVKTSTVWAWIRRGQLKAFHRPGTPYYLVREDQLTEFQENHFKPLEKTK